MDIPIEIKHLIKSNIISDMCILPNRYVNVENFNDMQIGYRIHACTGKSLVSEKNGDWQENWYVIAQNYFADPFYVDFSEQKLGYPVYFSFHGAGMWEPIQVAETTDQFESILQKIKENEEKFPSEMGLLTQIIDINNEFWKEVHEEFNQERTENESTSVDTSDWIMGRLIITNLGTIERGPNKMKVITYLKTELGLTPQQTLTLSKQPLIEVKKGYLKHLKDDMEYLCSLGATANFYTD